MKKCILSLFFVLTFFAFQQAKASESYILLRTPVPAEIMGMSPNGRYVTGYLTGESCGFLWDLHTYEFIRLSAPGKPSCGNDVSNNGIVAGTFEDPNATANGAAIKSGGYWKEGKWYSLENIDGLPVSVYDNGSMPMGISADGKYISGGAYTKKGKMTPCLWENGLIKYVYKLPYTDPYDEGVAYDINDEGTIASGWAMTPENRSAYIWTPEPEILVESTDGFSYMYHAGRFSPNNKYILCQGDDVFIYEIDTENRINIPPTSEAILFFAPIWVGDDKTVLGYEKNDPMDMPRATIHKEGLGTMYLKGYLEEYANVSFAQEEILGIAKPSGISPDGKTFAITTYNQMGEFYGYIVITDVNTSNLPPITAIAKQMSGVTSVRISWGLPITNPSEVTGYNIYKNGVKLNAEIIKNKFYYDNTNNVGDVCDYQVTAIYGTTESEKTIVSKVNIVNPMMMDNAAPTDLRGRASGYNDVLLKWNKPVFGDAVLKWNSDSNEQLSGFGMNEAGSFYYAVKYDKAMLSCYPADMKISKIALTPMAAPADFEVFLRIGKKNIYSHKITQNLILENSNALTIDSGLTIGSVIEDMNEEDLYLVVKVTTKDDGVYVAGLDAAISVVGYSDLVSRDDKNWQSLEIETEGMVSGSWALSLILDSPNDPKRLACYEVYRDGVMVEKANSRLGDVVYSFIDNNLTGNQYEYSVKASYANSTASVLSAETGQCTVKIANNVEPCTPAVNVAAYKHGTEELNDVEVVWDSPETPEKQELSYTNWVKGSSIDLTGGQGQDLYIGMKFDQNKTSLYEGFEISEFVFYPIGKASKFQLYIIEDGEDVYTQEITEFTINKKNVIKLNKRVMINPGKDLTIAVGAIGLIDTRVFSLDNQMPFVDIADLYSQTTPFSMYSIAYDSGVYGNWMLGINVSNGVSKGVLGNNQIRYNVYLGENKVNSSYITDNKFTIVGNTAGTKQLVKVGAVYSECGEKMSAAVEIKDPTSVEELENSINVYPNPATEAINIDGDVVSVSMTDVTGKVVFNGVDKKINVKNFNVGIYILNINTPNGTVVKRVAVSK